MLRLSPRVSEEKKIHGNQLLTMLWMLYSCPSPKAFTKIDGVRKNVEYDKEETAR